MTYYKTITAMFWTKQITWGFI